MIKTVHERYKKNPDRNPGYIEGPIAKPIRAGSLIVGYQGNEFKLRTLYDIVGWIFSVVGNVPVGATRENYYYALMMIAHVFCTKLIPATTSPQRKGQPPKEIPSKAPEVWSVMWFKQMVNHRLVTRVVLGANLDMPPQILKDDAKDFRKDLLKREGILIWRDGTPIPAQMLGPRGITGQDFGHCAESYPLLFICSLAKDRSEAFEIRGSAEGFSAKTPTLYNASASTITPYRDADGNVDLSVILPCLNCAYLIGGLGHGFTVARFEEGLTRTPDYPGKARY